MLSVGVLRNTWKICIAKLTLLDPNPAVPPAIFSKENPVFPSHRGSIYLFKTHEMFYRTQGKQILNKVVGQSHGWGGGGGVMSPGGIFQSFGRKVEHS